MKKELIFLFCFLLYTNVFSQEATCDAPKEETLEDFNSITKCTLTDPKKKNASKKQISVRVMAPKMRFLKKRNEKVNKNASVINRLHTNGVKTTSREAVLSKSLVLKQNIVNISRNLSREQVKKAHKFSTVENIPSFKNCQNTSHQDQLHCFNTEMIRHIERHFHYPNEAVVNKLEGEVWVRFIINKDGTIGNIKALKSDNILRQEAIRVVSLLPQFTPAKDKGTRVPVKYGFPIMFALNEN